MGQKGETRWQEVMEQFNEPEKWEKKTPEEQEKERLKFEITEELGLLDKVERLGWKGLTARETGRIGGRMNQKKKEKRNGE
jgi:hypothetical protein